MQTIAQRDLRNRSAQVLREAEAGETFVVTVDGRPVAQLGPLPRRTFISGTELAELLASPTDTTVLADLRGLLDDEAQNPWDPS